jgi:hypothetical protein
MSTSASALTDRVPYCVVKRNCDGPSIVSREGPQSDTWTCKRCGGTAESAPGAIPSFRRKIEP